MENNEQHCFTAFKNKSSKQAQVCTLKQVMNAIIGGTWKKEIQEIRDLLAAGETEKASEKKAALVYVTYSGIFEGGHKATQLKEYSRYLVADFDEVDPERVDEYLQKMKEIPWLGSAFATPSLGLKAIVLVDSDAPRHKEAYRQAMKKLEDILGLKTDKACSDICRGHFVSYSPTGWVRDDVTPLHIEPEEEPQHTLKPEKGTTGKGGIPPVTAATTGKKMPSPVSPKQAAHLMQEAMTKQNERMTYSLHNRNNYIYQLMRTLNSKGVDRETAAMLATPMFDLNETEINQTVNSAYTHTEEFGKNQEKEKTQIELVEEYLGKHFVLRRNIVLGQLEFLHLGDREENWCPMTDYEENSILRDLLLNHFNIKPNLLHNILGSDYAPLFDPFKDYLENLPPWDGVTDYIGQVAATVKAADQEAFANDFRKWMVATVAGWLYADVCNETVLAFTGPQGTYKSTFLRKLVPPLLERYSCSVTGIPSADDKDARMSLAQCGFINMEEVEVMTMREQAHFKSMLTQKEVNERPAYARNKEVMPRRAAFTASTNLHDILKDPSGHRRWAFHQILDIASPYLFHFPYEGVYAQAYALLMKGFRYWYEGNETVELNLRNEKFRCATIEEEQLAVCFRRPEEYESYDLLTASQVMERMMMFLHTPMSLVNVGRALRHSGYECVKRKGINVYKVKQLDATDIEINKHKREECL